MLKLLAQEILLKALLPCLCIFLGIRGTYVGSSHGLGSVFVHEVSFFTMFNAFILPGKP